MGRGAGRHRGQVRTRDTCHHHATCYNDATYPVRVVVIDDGLDSSHPDLAPNFSAEISHDFNGEDEDVSPRWRLGAQLL